jgi:DnaK suppressor protein
MDIAEAKAALLALKQELASRVQRTQSVEMESQQLVLSLDADGKRELRAIDAALERIEAGTYGECARCGNEIAEARLRALPYAALCIDCAKAEEG